MRSAHHDGHVDAKKLMIADEQDGAAFFVVWDTSQAFLQLPILAYREENRTCETVHRLTVRAFVDRECHAFRILAGINPLDFISCSTVPNPVLIMVEQQLCIIPSTAMPGTVFIAITIKLF